LHASQSCDHDRARTQVVDATGGGLNAAEKLIFCYAPHGMLPAGAAYAAHLPSWRAAFPGIAPRTLTASIMHSVPGVRDMSAWLGFYGVSRVPFARALAAHRHVLLCPGGQQELLHAAAAWDAAAPAVRLCTQHKGFVRMALEQNAALVPMVVYGELLQLRNVCTWRWLQRLTYKRLGALLTLGSDAWHAMGASRTVCDFNSLTSIAYAACEQCRYQVACQNSGVTLCRLPCPISATRPSLDAPAGSRAKYFRSRAACAAPSPHNFWGSN
jgi:Diacylglycerol acyltransferase